MIDTDTEYHLVKGERNQGKLSELERIKHKLDIRGGLHIPDNYEYHKMINNLILKLTKEQEEQYLLKNSSRLYGLLSGELDLLLNYHLKYLTIKTVKYNKTLKFKLNISMYEYIYVWYPETYDKYYNGNCVIPTRIFFKIDKAERKLEKCLKK